MTKFAKFQIGVGAVLALLAAYPAAAQEQPQIRLAKQFGISYLPLTVMEERKLLEKHTQAAGLANIKVEWAQLASGAPMNDALSANPFANTSGNPPPKYSPSTSGGRRASRSGLNSTSSAPQ